MPDQDPWALIQRELKQLFADDEYKQLRPLLDRLQQMVNVGAPHSDAALGVLTAIKKLHEETRQGVSGRERVEEIISGYINPSWNVTGNVHQANRDLVFNTVISVFQQAGRELRLPEPKKVSVPVVLLVMTAAQAQELVSGAAFGGGPPALQDDFQMLRRLLEQEGAPDWVKRYQARPEDWQPFSAMPGGATIEQIVAQALDELNRVEGYQPSLAPSFKDIYTLHQSRYVLRHLRQDGCVVILDSLSLRHPGLQRAFHQAALDAYPRTSVVTIAPNAKALDTARTLSVVLQLQFADTEFSRRRLDKYEDYGACEELSDARRFEHWLLDRVRKLGHPAVAVEPGIRPYMGIQPK
jgi:hypothetical protein